MDIYQVAVFYNEVSLGKTTAVCLIGHWPEHSELQEIVQANQLSETAFVVQEDGGFAIRWFKQDVELDLYADAAIPAAHVLFNHKAVQGDDIVFYSRSRVFRVYRNGERLIVDLPVNTPDKIELTHDQSSWFLKTPSEAYQSRTSYILLFDNETDIRNIKSNPRSIATCSGDTVIIVAAKGDSVDFVFRVFTPHTVTGEDTVTGLPLTILVPYWSAKLGKQQLDAMQLSASVAYFRCRNLGDCTEITGLAKTI